MGQPFLVNLFRLKFYESSTPHQDCQTIILLDELRYLRTPNLLVVSFSHSLPAVVTSPNVAILVVPFSMRDTTYRAILT